MSTIRQARPGDLSALAVIQSTTFKEAYRGLLDPDWLSALSEAKLAGQWRVMLDKASRGDDEAVLVAEHRGKQVGFVTIGAERSPNAEWTCEIPMLYVSKAMRGRGIGRALMREAADHSLRRGMFSIGLWVLRENRGARRFYQSLGGSATSSRVDRIGRWMAPQVAYVWSDIAGLAQRGSASARNRP
jgi:ribosomal protein S18 acetylase RimI-like enzyme